MMQAGLNQRMVHQFMLKQQIKFVEGGLGYNDEQLAMIEPSFYMGSSQQINSR